MDTSFDKIFPLYCVENDLLVSKTGDISMMYQIKLPQIYSLSKTDIDEINTIFDKILRLLPEDTIFQKQDYFFVDTIEDKLSDKGDILSKSDNIHYFEKPTMTHECFIIITKNTKNNSSIASNPSGYRKILENLEKYFNDVKLCMSFVESKDFFEITRLKDDAILRLVSNFFSLSNKSTNTLNDISITDKIKLGKKSAEIYAISSNNNLPPVLENVIRDKNYSTQKTDFFLPFTQPYCLGLECNHIYNQIVYIENSKKFDQEIRSKMNQFKSVAVLSNENMLYYDSINNLVNNCIEKDLKFVKHHYNVILWEEDELSLKKSRNKLENIFRDINVYPKHLKLGLIDTFMGSAPGAAKTIPKSFRFVGISEQCPALMNFESYYESFKDGILVSDRKNGAPVRLDMWDEPLKRGIIVNRNRLIFGPSGTGKSFLINHIASQYYTQGHHIVMIDIGDSYKKLCNLVNGKYFTYEFDEPLEFNPFYIFGTVEDEKKEFLTSLIMFLWKGDTTFSREERQIISLYIDAFYLHIKNTDVFPKFNTFYEFVMENRMEYNEEKYFDKLSLDLSLREFYDGKFSHILNSDEPISLTEERFIVFEMDNIKDHPILFPLVTMLCIDAIMEKIRTLKGIKKSIFIDECWKPISKGDMADFIKYMYKTVRKHYGEIAIATQDIEDIISTTAGAAMINNTDTQILLSHKKKMASKDKFQESLSFTNSDLDKLFSTDKHEVFVKIGSFSNVYKIDVSKERYACYTSNAEENAFIFSRYKQHKNMKLAINEFINEY